MYLYTWYSGIAEAARVVRGTAILRHRVAVSYMYNSEPSVTGGLYSPSDMSSMSVTQIYVQLNINHIYIVNYETLLFINEQGIHNHLL